MALLFLPLKPFCPTRSVFFTPKMSKSVYSRTLDIWTSWTDRSKNGMKLKIAYATVLLLVQNVFYETVTFHSLKKSKILSKGHVSAPFLKWYNVGHSTVSDMKKGKNQNQTEIPITAGLIIASFKLKFIHTKWE